MINNNPFKKIESKPLKIHVPTRLKIIFAVTWLVLSITAIKAVDVLNLNRFKVDRITFSQMSPVGLQVLSNIENNEYKKYIQTIYVKEPHKNKLVVIVKPLYWENMPYQTRNQILTTVEQSWTNVYKKNTPDNKNKPEVFFGNNL